MKQFITWKAVADSLPPMGERVLVKTITRKVAIASRIEDNSVAQGWRWSAPTLAIEFWENLPE